MRIQGALRPSVCVLALVVALTSAPLMARAGWTPDGVTVLASTAYLAPLVACRDDANGTFVVWQEAAASGQPGVLRAQHVLATGDVDPAWPLTGARVCDEPVLRTRLGAVPDGLGGVYVWWVEGRIVFMSRILGDGTVAVGWTARGRSFGSMLERQAAPDVIADGAHGIYTVWPVGTLVPEDPVGLRVMHLVFDGQAAEGWPASGARIVEDPSGALTMEAWPQLALADDGGVFLAWATWSLDTTVTPSEFRLIRLAPDGTTAAGWADGGMTSRPFALTLTDYLQVQPSSEIESSQIAIAPDGDGGVFLYTNDPAALIHWSLLEDPEPRLERRRRDGTPHPDWPEGWVATPWGSALPGLENSLRVLSDDHGGAWVASPTVYTDYPLVQHYQHYGRTGETTPTWAGIEMLALGHEVGLDAVGGLYWAEYHPTGPTSHWGPNAFLGVGHSNTPFDPLFQESHSTPWLWWFGDIALASTGDGGAVFFWSQVNERFGLFARRFSPVGQTIAVDAMPSSLALRRLRYVAGAGVRARVALTGGSARLDLFDLAGRRVASERFGADARGEREVTLVGTERLEAGLFFARLTARDGARLGRVIVTR